MDLDVYTLALASALVTFASGMVLLMNWAHERTDGPALLWGMANAAMGVGIALLALHDVLPRFLVTVVSPVLLSGCSAAVWVAARQFNLRAIPVALVAPVTSAWIAAVVYLDVFVSTSHSVALTMGGSACFYGMAAMEFWWSRRDRLRGRTPMIIVLAVQSIALFLATFEFLTPQLSPLPPVGLFGLIHFVAPVYGVASAVFVVAMLKERTEAEYKAAALIDPLTQLLNRGAFLLRAERHIDRGRHRDEPVTLLAFDLDHFKQVNDTFGHPTGDKVLQVFSTILTKGLRPGDTVGRIGGEEFAALLPGCGVEAAVVIAQRIGANLAQDGQFMEGRRIGATVSIGVATANRQSCRLEEMMARADMALYKAKGSGRNRVVVDDEVPKPRNSKIVRIA